MPPADTDRRLRRLVAKLAAASAEDVETILDDLEPRQRTVVSSLLAEYLGGETAPAVQATEPASLAFAGFSSWLTLRLTNSAEPGVAGSQPASFSMTPTAMTGLREAAAILGAQTSDHAPPVETSAGWLGSLTRRLQARP